MQRLLRSKRPQPKGQDLVHHLQVQEFLHFQKDGMQRPFWKKTRKESASFIAATAGHGNRVRN